jgi:replicative DNA helicase Mcm
MSQSQHADLVDRLAQFLRDYYQEDMAQLAQRYPNDQQSLWIDYQTLFKFDADLADDFCRKPAEMTEFLNEAIANFDLPADVNLDGARARVWNLPSSRTYSVGSYRSDQIEEYISVKGQVSKKTEVHPLPVVAAYECQRCGTLTRLPQNNGDLDEPHECQGCERQGPFELKRDESEWKDVQLLRVQLPPEQAKGANGADIEAIFEDDLTETLEAGDRATIAGRLTVEEPSDGDPGFVPKLSGQAVQVEESDFSTVEIERHLDDIHDIATGEYGDPYELLVDSIAPKVIGMEEVKEALALQLFGGVRAEYPNGTAERGDIHILLMGDPGTAKSTLLEDIEKKAPCSTFASGKGATAAGMTASAVKDDFGGDQWTLEAGALVLADGGIACIDELDKIPDNVVSSMHEALSKQRLDVSKAGINATLPSETSMLAAGNPKHGRFIQGQPVAEQIDLGPTIMSRMDLMFMLDDSPDADKDEKIINGKIENRQKAIEFSKSNSNEDEDFDDIQPAVGTDILRAWIAFAKENVFPTTTEEAAAELEDSFKRLRLQNGEQADSPVPVTLRKLEAIQRLAEASARVRLSQSVEMEDIDRARRLVGRSMRDVGFDPESGQLDADIVETGSAKSQQERMEWIRSFIAKEEGVDAVSHEELVDAAQDAGISENTLEFSVAKLKETGKIYEPGTDNYRTS